MLLLVVPTETGDCTCCCWWYPQKRGIVRAVARGTHRNGGLHVLLLLVPTETGDCTCCCWWYPQRGLHVLLMVVPTETGDCTCCCWWYPQKRGIPSAAAGGTRRNVQFANVKKLKETRVRRPVYRKTIAWQRGNTGGTSVFLIFHD